ncbi:hypothetical protein Poly30_31740 [Planctomycetes bacterium Poly30]|uniref:Uncharacterized protein n=1 Tax=Saltatorellus ferox TaxID=2528018 RepID=A0A518EU76_9BACT|nr:hypothetical protein Poly30_31740 [Planctomycetes bacterium Poly30]
MRTSTASNPAPSSVGARAQRIAWFGAGVACALGALTLLDSAQARLSSPIASAAPLPIAPAPSLLLGAPAAVQGANGNSSQNDLVRPLPVTSSGVTGDSNNRMIAVTGNDITGQSVLYLVDTIDKQLAVYQASGGAPGTQNVKLVGARNISLDLQLDGLNDRTEVDKQPLTYKDLERRFNNSTDNSRTAPSGVPR